MKIKNIKQEKAITLIALVITIIVLLILAGVAISMLSGENGILTRASEAKENTEIAQKEEEQKLENMELQTYLLSNSNYKCANGYITGIEPGDTIESLKKVLPEGYEITKKYVYDNDILIEKDIEDSDVELATGMVVEKDGKEIAKTVILGDINCDGDISKKDLRITLKYIDFEDYEGNTLTDFQKVAMNLYIDNELNYKDYNEFSKYFDGTYNTINQNRKIQTSGKEIKRYYTDLQEYIKLLNEKSTEYSFEYNNETDTYKLKGVKENTKVESLINALPDSKEIEILDTEKEPVSTDSEVMNGYYISIKLQGDNTTLDVYFAKIEVD